MTKFSVQVGEGSRPKRPRRPPAVFDSPSPSPPRLFPFATDRLITDQDDDVDYNDAQTDESQPQQEEDERDVDIAAEEDDHQIPTADMVSRDSNARFLFLQPTRTGSDSLDLTRNGSLFFTLTDPEVFDCPICYDVLTIPVYQCENGHIACFSCCTKLAQKCPACSMPIGYSRCRAMEKVLESVKVPCQYAKYGCKEMVSFSKKLDHDKTCNYGPCSCPASGCHFVSSTEQLYVHFSAKHAGCGVGFQFNQSESIFFTSSVKSLILRERTNGVLFILNNRVEPIGNAIAVSCIGPASSKEGYFYELTAKMEGGNLKFQSFTKHIASRVDQSPSKGFLLVPSCFFGLQGQIILDLCIWKYGAHPANIQRSNNAI